MLNLSQQEPRLFKNLYFTFDQSILKGFDCVFSNALLSYITEFSKSCTYLSICHFSNPVEYAWTPIKEHAIWRTLIIDKKKNDVM